MFQGYVKSVNLSHVNDEVATTIHENLVRCVNRGKDLVSHVTSQHVQETEAGPQKPLYPRNNTEIRLYTIQNTQA